MTTDIARMGGMSCVVCHHAQRAEIEEMLVSGEYSIRGIARHWELAPESTRRHLRHHLTPALQEAARAVPGLQATQVVARLQAVADAAREVRLHAEETGNDKLALAAGRSEQIALESLISKLGITSVSDAENDAQEFVARLVHTLGSLARTRPEFGHVLADNLDQAGLEGMAESARNQANRAAQIHEPRQEIDR